MKVKIILNSIILLISTLLASSTIAQEADITATNGVVNNTSENIDTTDTSDVNDSENKAKEALAALDELTALKVLFNPTGASLEVFELAKKVIERIVKETRDNQQVVFDAVKLLENSLYKLENKGKYDGFINDVQGTFQP